MVGGINLKSMFLGENSSMGLRLNKMHFEYTAKDDILINIENCLHIQKCDIQLEIDLTNVCLCVSHAYEITLIDERKGCKWLQSNTE